METLLREKRLNFAAHTLRDKTEACHFLVRQEIQARTPWGKLVAHDIEASGLSLESFLQNPPEAAALKEHLITRRPTQPLPREQNARAGNGKSRACQRKTQKQRQNIQKQREEQAQQHAEFVQQISGKRWERIPGARRKAWKTEEAHPVQFEVESESFCENSGREEARVCGQWFQREIDGTWTAR